MRKWVYIAAALMVLTVLGLTVWEGKRVGEPVYDGKRLTLWVEEFDRDFLNRRGQATPAEIAIRKIGTNALPVLLKMACAKDSALKKKVMAFLKKHPSIKLKLRSDQEYHAVSDGGFAALREMGKPAVPALIALLKHPDAEIRDTAGLDLMWIGPDAQDAVPALVKCLNDPDWRVRFRATRCLRDIHTRPDLAVPALMRSLEQPGVPKTETVAALLQFGPQAKAAAPAICRLLEDQSDMAWQARCGAIHALERIEADERVVIPALTRSLNDRHDVVRRMVTNFFLRLDPVAATEAGVNAPGQ